MFTPRKTSLPSPSLEDSFFPLSSSSSMSLSFALPPSMSSPGSCDSGGGLDPDLILAAELGQALLEKNEELAASLVQSQRQVEVGENLFAFSALAAHLLNTRVPLLSNPGTNNTFKLWFKRSGQV